MYKLVTLLKDKGRNHRHGKWQESKDEFQPLFGLELVLYSWGIINFISMEDWLHWWPSECPLWIMLLRGDSTTPGWVCLYTAGWVSFSTAWIWAVLWFVLAKIKKMVEVTSYLDLKRSIWFHCFLETYYFQENKLSPLCWEMRPMTLYSLAHPFNYSWVVDMSTNTSWTCRLPTELLAFHRYMIESSRAKATLTILKSNQMLIVLIFGTLE